MARRRDATHYRAPHRENNNQNMRCATAMLALTLPTASGMAFGLRTLSRRIMMSAGQGRGKIYEDITKTIGNTPVVKISDKL